MQPSKFESGQVINESAQVAKNEKILSLQRIKPAEKHLPENWKFDRDEANAR